MSSITFTSQYNIGKIIISPSTFIEEYLHGIPLIDSNGNSYSIRSIRTKIINATTQLEHFLKIKTIEQTINEEIHDFNYEEWMNWGHIKLNYRPNVLIALDCYLNTQKVTSFSIALLTIQGRNIALVPGSGNLVTSIWFNNAGVYPILQSGVRLVPNFFHVTYTTGFTVIPNDILQVISKIAAIQILAILGEIVIGAGITSESISFDGLSESMSSTNSSGNSAFGARIKQYSTELIHDLAVLQSYYRGFIFETL